MITIIEMYADKLLWIRKMPAHTVITIHLNNNTIMNVYTYCVCIHKCLVYMYNMIISHLQTFIYP